MKCWHRHIFTLGAQYFVIYDEVEANDEWDIEWRLYMPEGLGIEGASARLIRNGRELRKPVDVAVTGVENSHYRFQKDQLSILLKRGSYFLKVGMEG